MPCTDPIDLNCSAFFCSTWQPRRVVITREIISFAFDEDDVELDYIPLADVEFVKLMSELRSDGRRALDSQGRRALDSHGRRGELDSLGRRRPAHAHPSDLESYRPGATPQASGAPLHPAGLRGACAPAQRGTGVGRA